MKIRTSLVASIFFLVVLVVPTKAFAVIQSLDGLTVQNQTFVDDSNVIISPSGSTHTLGWNGYLPISRGGTGVGSFTDGSIPFIFNGIFSQDNSNFFWDNINKRLGIGTNSPTAALEVTSDAKINSLTVGRGGRSLLTNTALGYNVLSSNSSSNDNTAIGYGALSTGSFNGEDNTAIGSLALDSSTTGSYNTALGSEALRANTTGTANIALGAQALGGSTTASSNIGIGFRSLTSITTDGSNVAIGDSSGRWITTGISNVMIGTNTAFYQSDGSTNLTAANNSVYIGANVQGYDNNDNNSIVIGQAAIGAGANKSVIGNSAMTDVYFGSVNGNANTHAKKMYLGSSSVPGCIIMGDTAGGVGYITLNSGVLTVSSTPPSACQ